MIYIFIVVFLFKYEVLIVGLQLFYINFFIFKNEGFNGFNYIFRKFKCFLILFFIDVFVFSLVDLKNEIEGDIMD